VRTQSLPAPEHLKPGENLWKAKNVPSIVWPILLTWSVALDLPQPGITGRTQVEIKISLSNCYSPQNVRKIHDPTKWRQNNNDRSKVGVSGEPQTLELLLGSTLQKSLSSHALACLQEVFQALPANSPIPSDIISLPCLQVQEEDSAKEKKRQGPTVP
jgi:hypothetical protein